MDVLLSGVASSGRKCPKCGARLPTGIQDCRTLFRAVRTRQLSDPALADLHWLTADAYALQHAERRGPGSTAFHLLRLYRILECGGEPQCRVGATGAVDKPFERSIGQFPEIGAPAERGRLTIAEVYGAVRSGDHATRVREWAHAVWDAYRPHHAWARATFKSAGGADRLLEA